MKVTSSKSRGCDDLLISIIEMSQSILVQQNDLFQHRLDSKQLAKQWNQQSSLQSPKRDTERVIAATVIRCPKKTTSTVTLICTKNKFV
ncbi:unnamed protein product [Schistosoma rodhaini]|nr:unnamed protein product [Schistosoma rodhaini]